MIYTNNVIYQCYAISVRNDISFNAISNQNSWKQMTRRADNSTVILQIKNRSEMCIIHMNLVYKHNTK